MHYFAVEQDYIFKDRPGLIHSAAMKINLFKSSFSNGWKVWMKIFPMFEKNKRHFNAFGVINSKGWKILFLMFPMVGSALCAQAIDVRSRDPYYSAVVLNADTGAILWEDHASAEAYPASMIKMMNLFVVLDELAEGKLTLDQPVRVTREIALVGGRQVWLKEGEVFPLEELIYATAIHSANDAATALAIVSSGTREAHAEKMNAKAQALGLSNTVFHNVHGLPPGPGQLPDVSTALDMARLAHALMAAHPGVHKYSSVYMRDFRPGDHRVTLTSSNKLLRNVEGCDGMKTGYFSAGGFSITATAKRGDQRILAVVMGCKSKNVRNQWAERLLERGFVLANAQ